MILNRVIKEFNHNNEPEIFIEVLFDTEEYGSVIFSRWFSLPDCHSWTETDIIARMLKFKNIAITNYKSMLERPEPEIEDL